MKLNLVLKDVLGRDKMQIFKGMAESADQRYFFDTALLPAGLYQVVVNYESGSCVKKLVVR